MKLTNAQINLLLRLKRNEYIRNIDGGIWYGTAFRSVHKPTIAVLVRKGLARIGSDYPRQTLHITNAGEAWLATWEKELSAK